MSYSEIQIAITTILLAIVVYLYFNRSRNRSSNPSSSIPSDHDKLVADYIKQYQDLFGIAPQLITKSNMNTDHIVKPSESSLIHLKLSELQQYNGTINNKVYVAIKDRIYDVTDDAKYFIDKSLAGQDITRILALNANDKTQLNHDSSALKSLKFEEIQRLESIIEYIYNNKYKCVGYFHYNDDINYNSNIPSVDNNSILHTSIENNDLKTIQSLFGNNTDKIKLTNEQCKRTFMSPLHKAIENTSNIEIVKLLLENGADLNSKASLYDNETPIDMAKRFQRDEIIKLIEAQAIQNNKYKNATADKSPSNGYDIDFKSRNSSASVSRNLTWNEVANILNLLIKSTTKPSKQLTIANEYVQTQLLMQDSQALSDPKKLKKMQQQAQKTGAAMKIVGPITPDSLLKSMQSDTNTSPTPTTKRSSIAALFSRSTSKSTVSNSPTSNNDSVNISNSDSNSTNSNGSDIDSKLPTDLLGLLHTNTGYKYLLNHLYNEFSEENLLAVQAIENYRKRPSVNNLKIIFNKYLSDNAELQINISDRNRTNIEKIIKKIDDGCKIANKSIGSIPNIIDSMTGTTNNYNENDELILETILDDVYREIIKLLDKDSFARFQQTPLFNDYLRGKQAPDIVKRADDDKNYDNFTDF
jgi:predicted heme/steroid binding protein